MHIQAALQMYDHFVPLVREHITTLDPAKPLPRIAFSVSVAGKLIIGLST